MSPRPVFLGLLLALTVLGPTAAALPAAGALQDQEIERLGAQEHAEIDLMLRRGERGEALEILDEILAEDPGDVLSRVLRARARFDATDYAGALADAEQALREAGDPALSGTDAAGYAECARRLAELQLELGLHAEAAETLERAGEQLQPRYDPRDAWVLGRVLLSTGRRAEARAAFSSGAGTDGADDWRRLLAKARCQRALGDVRRAARSLVDADSAAAEADGTEPDVLVELGSLYFEVYGEVDDAVSLLHSPAEQYREALQIHSEHEGARLGLFEIYRFNFMRGRTSPAELLEAVFAARPSSIAGLEARVSAALDDGELRLARTSLEQLERIAPGRRDVRVQRAALSWIEHEREEAERILAELAAEDPGDSQPEREVGRHLLELYRFAEALPFLERAVERDEGDWRAMRDLGRALANTGEEKRALEMLDRAAEIAEGRKDAWRDNTRLILKRMQDTFLSVDGDTLRFTWLPDADAILRAYLVPFYSAAREELALRYGHTPGTVQIEVFRRWNDFSVRSTGFEGFPALGVCFGPVVTAVSPLSELRGSFSWARTSYHEFTHVIHLGLSHNRCPRWVTEGLATWEEGQKNQAWWRNMRRDLVDVRANERVIAVRKLNNAFRGPRVLFAYYQSGLLCEMLIEDHGFSPMVRLLEAFDRGLDLDAALDQVFDVTPEELDERFAAYVDEKIAALKIEPRWQPEHIFRLRFSLPRRAPEDPEDQKRWADEWCTVAWGFYWDGKRVDAEEALRMAGTVGELPPRGDFLRAELLLQRGDRDGAFEAYRRGFAGGGEDYRARMALAELFLAENELDEAEKQFLLAREAFPGFADQKLSAELALASLYERRGRQDQAMEARIDWLGYNAGDFDQRVLVALWLDRAGRQLESIRFWQEANEVDPFRRFLHHRWGLALRRLGRHEEALREFEVGLTVPAELDLDLRGASPFLTDELDGNPEAMMAEAGLRWQALEPELLGLKGLTLLELGRPQEAKAAAEAALEIDAQCDAAKTVMERLP